MKEKKSGRKLKLKKDTLRTLTPRAMAAAVGGTSGHPVCENHTEDYKCVVTTLAPNCAFQSLDCTGSQTCTDTCNLHTHEPFCSG